MTSYWSFLIPQINEHAFFNNFACNETCLVRARRRDQSKRIFLPLVRLVPNLFDADFSQDARQFRLVIFPNATSEMLVTLHKNMGTVQIPTSPPSFHNHGQPARLFTTLPSTEQSYLCFATPLRVDKSPSHSAKPTKCRWEINETTSVF